MINIRPKTKLQKLVMIAVFLVVAILLTMFIQEAIPSSDSEYRTSKLTSITIDLNTTPPEDVNNNAISLRGLCNGVEGGLSTTAGKPFRYRYALECASTNEFYPLAFLADVAFYLIILFGIYFIYLRILSRTDKN